MASSLIKAQDILFWKSSDTLMEVLTHRDTLLVSFTFQLNILQKLVGHHLQCILWPCLYVGEPQGSGIDGMMHVHTTQTTQNVQTHTCPHTHSLTNTHNISYTQTDDTWNQSMVQQLMREGNILSLFLKASPIGLMASTTWRFSFTLSINKLYMETGVASILRP